MGMMWLDNQPVTQQKPKKPMHPDSEFIRLKAINRQLVAACHEALQFRGMMLSLHDPLMLEGEKKEIRSRWKRAELAIRLAIEKADEN